jgi:dolichyl-phosphate-mannose--protein O-mannosyl transferase
MRVNLDHFETAVLFALLSSILLGLITNRTDREREIYGLRCFGWFMAALFGIGWFMRILHG